MRRIPIVLACIVLAACSHVPFVSKAPPASGKVVGIVEYDTGLTKFSTMTGVYHQDMCSKANPDVAVHLTDKEMKAILATAGKSKFFDARADFTQDWSAYGGPPAHCATFRLRVDAGGRHNEVRWDCGLDGSNTPPPDIAPVAEQVKQILRAKKEVQAMPWSKCQVR